MAADNGNPFTIRAALINSFARSATPKGMTEATGEELDLAAVADNELRMTSAVELGSLTCDSADKPAEHPEDC